MLYPAAPPRLAGIGFSDTVTKHTGLNLSSDLLGSFYNPLAAVPSLHFGYALIVGVALACSRDAGGARARGAYTRVHALRHRRHGEPLPVRRGGGRVVVAAAWWIASRLVRDAQQRTPGSRHVTSSALANAA